MGQKITALIVQKRNHERVNIYLDGNFAFSLARIVAAWLQIGQELSDSKIAELNMQDSLEIAFQMAIKFLSYRTRSEGEVRQHLLQKDIPQQVIESTLVRLKDSGLVNDAQFAASWIDNRTAFRPRSRRALTYELHQKGLSDKEIQKALAKYSDEEAAYAAATRQAHKYTRFEWPEFRRKLNAYLARRGFSYSVTDPVVHQVWQEIMLSAADNAINTEYHTENEVDR